MASAVGSKQISFRLLMEESKSFLEASSALSRYWLDEMLQVKPECQVLKINDINSARNIYCCYFIYMKQLSIECNRKSIIIYC
ncbi:hypothetical protein KFK09_026634 [Dendrobium nobile]|uniref:Uncharacterized protein n=1 Tax=Dendrobium nobile TaxID=94219 RepID=A0A8T3A8E4_DENNO|nr:hypothetical protein KFK09_026634 [Dendrobium nobile]